MSNDRTTEEIRNRLDIVQLVSEYLRLHKAGVRFRAPCPFHNEKDPSFYVSPERQRFHCFGCNEDGDIFTFVMKMEGMDFPEAMRHLAKKAGVELPEYRPDPNRSAKAKHRDRLYEANKLAAEFWHQILIKHPQAEAARQYVAKRQLNDNTIDQFMVGYAPESWEATSKFLKGKGFTDKELVDAGLASKSTRGGGTVYDRFRNRLMFPIRDAHGRHVGASGRIVPDTAGKDPDGEAKYINTAQTEIYYKGDILFGFDLAKQHIRQSGQTVVVEGNMDAVASHQAGVTNVVASSGTAFTENQLNLLKRLSDKLVLSFDNDEAGEKAARRSIDLAVKMGFEVRVLRLPEGAGKDPDDCIRQDPKLWEKAIEDAVPYMDWYLGLARQRTNFSDPYAKAKTSDFLLNEVAKLPSSVERSHWLKRLAEMFETPERELAEEVRKRISGQSRPAAAPAAQPSATQAAQGEAAAPVQPFKATDRFGLVSQFLVGLASAYPELAEIIINRVRPDQLTDQLKPLYTALVLHYNNARTDGQETKADRPAIFRPGDDQTGQTLTFLELQAEKEFGEMDAEARAEAAAKLVREVKSLHADRRKRQLAAEMADAERSKDDDRVAEIQRQLNELIL